MIISNLLRRLSGYLSIWIKDNKIISIKKDIFIKKTISNNLKKNHIIKKNLKKTHQIFNQTCTLVAIRDG